MMTLALEEKEAVRPSLEKKVVIETNVINPLREVPHLHPEEIEARVIDGRREKPDQDAIKWK